MLRRWMSPEAFRLVQELKPEMRTKFERSRGEAKFDSPLMDLGHGGTERVTKIGD